MWVNMKSLSYFHVYTHRDTAHNAQEKSKLNSCLWTDCSWSEAGSQVTTNITAKTWAQISAASRKTEQVLRLQRKIILSLN